VRQQGGFLFYLHTTRKDSCGSRGVNASFDKKTVQRLQDILNLDKETQNVLFRLIDTMIRDTKAKKAYS